MFSNGRTRRYFNVGSISSRRGLHSRNNTPINKSYGVGGDLVDSAVEGVHKLLDWWTGSAIPPKVANFLKSNGEDKITSLEVARVPIWKTLDLALDIMSGGEFGKVKKKLNYDKMFHLYVIVNGKWILEKNELFNVKPYSSSKDEEKINVNVNKDITISDFLKKASEGNEKSFYRDYDAFKSNCQDMVLRLLRSNGLLTNEISSFVKQPIEEIAKEIKPTTETAKNITNVGSLINRLLQLASGGKYSFAVGCRDIRRKRRPRGFSY